MAPSSTAPFFIVPTVISTISISIDTTVPQSSTVSAPVVFVTNPSDLNQVVGFKTLQIPESQRTGLPSDVTDNAPAALMIPEICPFPMLLFGFILMLPVIPWTSSLPPWLSLNLYPSIVTFSGLESNPNRPSLSTQRTSTTSTSSSSSPSSTAGDWLISTQMGTTQAQFNDLLTLLSKLGLTPYNILSSPALGFQQLIVGMNSSLASKIQQYKEAKIVDVVIQDFIIKDDDEPPLVSNATSSQNTRGAPVTYIGQDSNSNSSSTTQNRRRNTKEGTIIAIKDNILQRQMLSNSQGDGEYRFDSIGGEGAFVYVIDTGINDHDVFSSPNLIIEKHSAGESEGYGDPTGHGTCMASIACSNIGIMIKGTLVFMKVGDDNGKLRANAVFNGIVMAITDIVTKKREGMSVINISLGIPIQEGIESNFRKFLESAERNDIVVVTSTGNKGPGPIHKYPALLGQETSLIVVGSHGPDWTPASYSQTGPALTLYALGTGGVCASSTGGLRETRGTSAASAAVAGLIGYLKSLPSRNKLGPALMKQEVVKGARKVGSNLIAYNGARASCYDQKRDYIPGDPLPQTTSTLDPGACTLQKSTSSSSSSSPSSGSFSTANPATYVANPLFQSPRSSTITSISTSSNHPGLSAITVTSNGMVCVLIEGSTDPQCRPDTPTSIPIGTYGLV
ncbi:Peptidase S8/S53 domain containing protein [Elaphomyces granulatus]